MSPFEGSLGYLPLLLPVQENDIAVLSVQAHIWMPVLFFLSFFHSILLTPTATLLIVIRTYHHIINQVRKLGFPLFKTNAKKLSPCYLCPFEIVSIIYPSVAKPILPKCLTIHPSFHVPQLKPTRAEGFGRHFEHEDLKSWLNYLNMDLETL